MGKIVIDIDRVQHEVSVSTTDTLADVLRDGLGLTGTKIMCNEGECGACTVLMNGKPILS